MKLFNTLNTSASGLTAERLRLDVVANNIANASTTRTSDGGPYQKRAVVFKEKLVREMTNNGRKFINKGVEAAAIVRDQSPPRMVYNPSHPDANEKGFVAMPNVDLAVEMADMITATRAYEANVTVLNATKTMALKALEIGRG
ncbi:flagellar basal body rod protein FlgC [Desulfitibacter alkalitolerans]|uniref:flagellar basal body rod protein FlgC n=1 Tax=Desulfitibacter alkalitolerans TaxID=264641 RepID=UPI000489E287|nr:flagellar basal body rod protein FlgC [Desulfitibacter alkalitolerans]